MTAGQGSTPEEAARAYAALVDTLGKQVKELDAAVAGLRLSYRQAGGNLQTIVAEDMASIKESREEARRIATFLQGTELFGRYAQDADHHLQVANRWRIGALGVLTATPLIAFYLAKATALGDGAVLVALMPVLLLFFYTSIESFNHRRREFDRRRIALRVSAIEAFTKRRRDSGTAQERRMAEELLDEFVRRHFINPDLDSNEMTYLGPRFSFVTVMDRRQHRDTPDAKSAKA